MTSGIGNPDWQRRYAVSAVPILALQYPDTGSNVSAVSDSNGFQYLMVTTDTTRTTAIVHVVVEWWQDAAGTVNMGSADWVLPAGTFVAQKVPVATRYYTLEIIGLTVGNGSSVGVSVYGTNADQENILTQNTSQPMLFAGPTVNAGATVTLPVAGMFGGQVMLMVDDTVNNKWSAKLQFFDWQSTAYHSVWAGYGAVLGQAVSLMVNMPYAPMQLLVTNLDAVNNQFFVSVVAP